MATIIATPSAQVEFVQSPATNSSTSSGQSAKTQISPEMTNDGQIIFQPQKNQDLQKEIQVSPTSVPTPPPTPIQYDFLNPRVIGVFIGLIFLWIYVRRLKKKRIVH